jgi:hypothetical protein
MYGIRQVGHDHLQQIATPDYEIVAGLCTRWREILRGISQKARIYGHQWPLSERAANAGMRQALKNVFALKEDEFFVPENYASVGAIGAICAVMEEPSLKTEFSWP